MLCGIAAACSKGPSSPAVSPVKEAAPQAYALEGTEVREIRAKALQRDYQLFVGLPPSYGHSDRRYPVLFVTDANYAFPLMRSIARRVGNGGQDVEEFILVGLSYAKGDTPEYSRRRDYTPTDNGDEDAVSDMPGRAPVYGEADGYRRFIAEEVFPFVAQHYRADMKRKIYAGHSYGGLFGVHVLLTEPTMFEQYILGSPSLWFDQRVVFATERAYAKTHSDLPARLFMAVASFETTNGRSNDPRYNKTIDMIRDLQTLEQLLISRRYPKLQIKTAIIEDEDHLTVFPALITRGMKWALPRRPPGAETASAVARP
jgi:predicted alpha/beta superfamily hydrolase